MSAPLIIDSFAGGGGASTGIELALGRSPDIAINHCGPALALHAANHPDTLHLDSNIWDVDPRSVTKGRPVGLLWASPDCKHFSKAKGSAVRDRNVRDLAWVVVRWAEDVRPDVVLLENVEEFKTWSPVGEDGQPVPGLSGVTYDLWLRRFRKAGYKIQARELRACDYGAPTIRKRLFIIARCDGRRIVWPKPTHGDPRSDAVRQGKLLPWLTAAECIDWSLPCPSIFDTAAQIRAKHGLAVKRPLAPNTLARVARGMRRYVLDAERPFIVSPAQHGGGTCPGALTPSLMSLKGTTGRSSHVDAPHPTVLAGGNHAALVAPVLTYAQQGGGLRAPSAPHNTITASPKDQNALLAASLVQMGYGERPGQAPRILNLADPLGTVVAAGKHAAVAAFLAQHNNPRQADSVNPGRAAEEPLSTVTATGSQQGLVTAWMAKWFGTPQDPRLEEPCHTVTTRDRFDVEAATLMAPPFSGEHEARTREVASFLRAHDAWDEREFVTLAIAGTTYVVVDIGLRMLTARELFRAQGFPDDYVIEGVWQQRADEEWVWHPFTKEVQVSCCGNSVCPPLAAALAAANCAHLHEEQRQEVRHG